MDLLKEKTLLKFLTMRWFRLSGEICHLGGLASRKVRVSLPILLEVCILAAIRIAV